MDTAITGHLSETYYIGAIAIGAMIFNFLYWGFGFLRMGTTGLTAQAYGEGNREKVFQMFLRAILMALLFAFIILALQILVKMVGFSIVSTSKDVEFWAKEYFDIRIWAAPATLSLYAFHGWFLGMQNAKYPLILAVLVNVLNLVLNLLFVYQYDMKSNGIALGTLFAQYFGLLLAIILFKKKYSNYITKPNWKVLFHLEELKKFFSVNFDIFIRTLAIIFAFTYFTAKSATFGENILAANTILLQLWMILSYSVDGFAFAAESLVGKYIGKKDMKKLNEVIKYIFIWAISLGAIYSLVYFLFGKEIILIFTNKNILVNLSLSYFGWTVAAPLVSSFCFVWDGIYIGATATKPMRNSMLFSALIIYLPTILITEQFIGNHAMWLGMLLFMFARGVTLFLTRKKIYNIIKH